MIDPVLNEDESIETPWPTSGTEGELGDGWTVLWPGDPGYEECLAYLNAPKD